MKLKQRYKGYITKENIYVSIYVYICLYMSNYFATGSTSMCDISSICSSNSEADASELIENIENIFSRGNICV